MDIISHFDPDFLEYRDSLLRFSDEVIEGDGLKYWGYMGGRSPQVSDVAKEESSVQSDVVTHDQMRYRRDFIDEKGREYMADGFQQARDLFINRVSDLSADFDKYEIGARVDRVRFHVVDRKAIERDYGFISLRWGYAGIGFHSNQAFMDSTAIHEMTHAIMGTYVECVDPLAMCLRSWVRDHDIHEGVAAEAERWIMGDDHDGTDPYPRRRRIAEKWIDEDSRASLYKALMVDIEPNTLESYLLIHEPSDLIRAMLSRD